MSDYLDDAKHAKEKLDTVSPSMCLAKWKQVSLHLTNGLNNSCYHPPLHKIDERQLADNPSALHNTDHKKQQRKLMLEGERPNECSYCWAIEDNGHISDRHYRSGEKWAMDSFGDVVNAAWDEDVNPSYVEVNFNNACNLACSYCSPQFSSTWQKQVDRYGAYPTTTPHNAPEHFDGGRRVIPQREENPYVDAFWKWWPELYPELKHFRMTGGEPLMDKNTYRVFDWVLANPKPDLHINVTSNFSVEPKLFDKYMNTVGKMCEGENIEHFMQFVSVDSFGQQAEYIRAGLNFDRLQRNVERFLTDIPGRNSITFIMTMNNMSVPGIQELLDWVLELRAKHSTTYQRIWFDTPLLYNPNWMSLRLLPASYQWKLEQTRDWMKTQISEGMTGFRDYEVDKLDRVIAWMKDSVPDRERRMKDFYLYFTEYDKRNATNFARTFPEMKEFWGECKYYAELHDGG